MPEMDGFTLVERIKQDPQLASAAIMMLTSTDQKTDVERCRQLGVSVHLLKPVKPTELRQAILRALRRDEQRDQQSTLPTPSPLGHRHLRILLAEDNPVNQKLAVRLLEKWGHAVVVVGTGQDALTAVAHEVFDLVLMDVQMPRMDGLTATAAIRARERSSQTHLPVVAMTANAMRGDKELCLAAGMDAYVSKPLKTTELRAIIEQVVSTPPPETRMSSVMVASQEEGDAVEL
jgi:CheY-like chemotaxis protein